MADQTPRRALPDARADNTGESPVLVVPTRFERARTVYELVSDVVTPQRIGLVLAALVLLVAGIAGGFDAVSAADDDTPTAAVGEVVDAAPFEITIKRARYGTELKPIAYRQDGRRHLFVTLDVRSKDRLPVPAGILLNAVRIDVPGLATNASGSLATPTAYRTGDGLSVRSLQPGVTVPVVLTWQQDAAAPVPETLTVTVNRQTWRTSTLEDSESWFDPEPVRVATLPVEALAEG